MHVWPVQEFPPLRWFPQSLQCGEWNRTGYCFLCAGWVKSKRQGFPVVVFWLRPNNLSPWGVWRSVFFCLQRLLRRCISVFLLLVTPVPQQVEGNPEGGEPKDVYLCQCGHSKNRPFCDGSHRSVNDAAAAVDVAAAAESLSDLSLSLLSSDASDFAAQQALLASLFSSGMVEV